MNECVEDMIKKEKDVPRPIATRQLASAKVYT